MSYIFFGALFANREDSTSSDFQHVILVNLPPMLITRTFLKVSLEPLTQHYHQIPKAGPKHTFRCSHQHWSQNTCDVGRKKLCFSWESMILCTPVRLQPDAIIWQGVECESEKPANTIVRFQCAIQLHEEEMGSSGGRGGFEKLQMVIFTCINRKLWSVIIVFFKFRIILKLFSTCKVVCTQLLQSWPYGL